MSLDGDVGLMWMEVGIKDRIASTRKFCVEPTPYRHLGDQDGS
jgi:hypothetical protein